MTTSEMKKSKYKRYIVELESQIANAKKWDCLGAGDLQIQALNNVLYHARGLQNEYHAIIKLIERNEKDGT